MISAFLSNRIGERKNIIEEIIFNDTSNSYEYTLSSGNFNLKNWNNGVSSNSDRFGNPYRAAFFNGNSIIGQEYKYINRIINNMTIHVSITRDRISEYEKIIEAPVLTEPWEKFFLFLNSTLMLFDFNGHTYEFYYVPPVDVNTLLSITVDNSYIKLYVNGVFQQQWEAVVTTPVDCYACSIGSQFQGKIDFYQLKNSTDTAEQVKNLYNELLYNRLL